jgi:leucyl-tRNA synthetase
MADTKLEADEVGKFTVEWVTPEQAVKEIHDDQHQYALARFTHYGAYKGDGLLRNSGSFDARDNREATAEIIEAIGGERTTSYRLRDWLVSRQRYWGCPIPVVYDPEGKAHLVPSEHLPWLLPTDVDFTPSDKSPLATSKELHERVERIFGEGWTPEYDTLDTFVDSSWYYARYLDPKDANDFSDQGLMKTWLPVNRYTGGAEHTTMHLLYSRFFYKALYDLALVPTSEPYLERINRGLIMGPDGQKMSKSKGNVVNPDEYVQKYGADAVRMYLAFIGPYNEPGNYPWKPEGVESMRRFLDRIAALAGNLSDGEASEGTRRALAKATEKVAADTERFKLNTAVSALMILVNELEALPSVPREAFMTLVTLLAPFAPHVSEYLFQMLTQAAAQDALTQTSVHQQPWPEADQALLASSMVTIGVQVSGKKRGEITLSPEAGEDEALVLAKALPAVDAALGGASPSRVIYVPGRILNFIP